MNSYQVELEDRLAYEFFLLLWLPPPRWLGGSQIHWSTQLEIMRCSECDCEGLYIVSFSLQKRWWTTIVDMGLEYLMIMPAHIEELTMHWSLPWWVVEHVEEWWSLDPPQCGPRWLASHQTMGIYLCVTLYLWFAFSILSFTLCYSFAYVSLSSSVCFPLLTRIV